MIAQVIDVSQLVPLRPEAQKELEARHRLQSKADFDKVAAIARGCVTNPIHWAATDKSGGVAKAGSGPAIWVSAFGAKRTFSDVALAPKAGW
jgi:hypothetical protein